MMKASSTPLAVLFLHVGWALEYEGDPHDLPQGKFGYIKEGNEDMWDALNFKSYEGVCYGYAPQEKLNMARLGAPGADSVDDVLVIWTATNPDGSGRYVVGWYRHATVFQERRNVRPDEVSSGVNAMARAADCHLVPADDRTFFVSCQRKGWPGTSSAFYAGDMLTGRQIDLVVAYVGGAPSHGFPPKIATVGARDGDRWPKKPDAEANARVEKAAEAVVETHFLERGWEVEHVQEEWFGWDMTMRNGARELYVEVKGRSGSGPVQLSANEYRTMCDERFRMRYRLAIVLRALTAPRLIVFGYRPGRDQWVAADGEVLAFTPAAVFASFSFSRSETATTGGVPRRRVASPRSNRPK